MKTGTRDTDPHDFDSDWMQGDESTDETAVEGDETDHPPGPLSYFPSARYASPALAVFILCLLFTILYGSGQYSDHLWVSGDALFHRHEWWRPFTAIFTHAGLKHLFSNALLVLLFGWMLHAYYGMALFPLASLAVGLLTNCVTVYLYDPGVRLLGSSGMAYGMVALWLICYLSHDSDRKLAARIMRAVGFAAVMLIPAAIEPRVSYLSHAVGFTLGIITGLLLARIRSPRVPVGPAWSRGQVKSS